MARRSAWVVVGILVGIALSPVAQAATTKYSSGGSGPTIRIENTGKGKALAAVSHTGKAGHFRRTFDSGRSPALYAQTDSQSVKSAAIVGKHPYSGSGTTYGVRGQANATKGRGIYGLATHKTGTNAGVFGLTRSKNGRGVWGYANASKGESYGVYGRSNGNAVNASGVFGYAAATTAGTGSALTNGVYGLAMSGAGAGVYGLAPNSNGIGLYGEGAGRGVYGVNLGIGPGVVGEGEEGVRGTGRFGVMGNATGTDGIGVLGAGSGDDQFGVYASGTLGLSAHLLATNNLAGTCTLTTGATSTICSFRSAFPTGFAPIVMVFPLGDPEGSAHWVSSTSSADFTLSASSAPTSDLSFNWLAVAICTNGAACSP